MRRHRATRARRGTIGIETAIVMIAFVVVASAVAYVIINMGFYAAQKSKETIGRGVESASSSLELDGSVIGKVDSKASSVEYLIIPVRLSVGRSLVDLANNTVMVSVFCSNFTIADIYEGVLTENETIGRDPPLEQVITYLNTSYYNSTTNTPKDVAVSVIYNDDGDTLLELNEKAFVVIQLNSTAHPLKPYDIAKVEVKIGTGAALTVVRQMPPGFTANEYVDLG
jgi:flagellin FlaB